MMYELGNTTLKAIHKQAKVNISVCSSQGQSHIILCSSGKTRCLQTRKFDSSFINGL